MGFGKFLLGGLCAAGAIIAAPVVLPAAAVAATTVGAGVAAAGGAIAAVGTAATGTIAAVGTAATGTIAAAGTAIASTAAGAAAASTMAAVGGAVGTAAGAVGLGSLATVAGTTAGATALGTIATSAVVGASSAVSGISKINKASDITKTAQERANKKREVFDKIEANTNDALETLGQLKLQVWSGFERYKKAIGKIKNLDEWAKLEIDGKKCLDKEELNDIQLLAISAKDVLKNGVVTLTGGQLAGLATSAGITSVATASTGTAIASLHGAAATNASLAALGGGALSSGGLGMAGGAVVANALTFAPMLAIGGVFLSSHGSKSLKDAEKVNKEVEKYIEELDIASKELDKLRGVSKKIENSILKYRHHYEELTDWLEKKVEEETDFHKYSMDEIKKLLVSGQVVSILKDLTLKKILNGDEVEEKAVDELVKVSDERWQDVQKDIA